MENTIEEMKNVRDKAVALYESRCDVHSSQNFAALLAAMDLLLASHQALLKGKVEGMTGKYPNHSQPCICPACNEIKGRNAALTDVLALLD